MCGRYALGIQASWVRYRIRQVGMDVDDELDDDDLRETYNFAPGYRGMVYRADTPATGANTQHDRETESEEQREDQAVPSDGDANPGDAEPHSEKMKPGHKLQAMQWGLIPFWTKRDPGFSSMIKTINCRDDSLAQNGGMWNTMKKNKRCIVVAQGFYEWLKKDNGKIKIPHFVKRKDGDLMYFAGLWDSVKYDDRDDRLWTYTIITTEVNQQLAFLHDRMPVIFDGGSESMKTWLDPSRTQWTQELQSLLEPFSGELDCYPVNKDVGKVGNNSSDFIVPIDSKENKSNIANFFGNAKSKVNEIQKPKNESAEPSAEPPPAEDKRKTIEVSNSESNAPLPIPVKSGDKRNRDDDDLKEKDAKQVKFERNLSPQKSEIKSPPPKVSGRKVRSATQNGSSLKAKPKASDGSQKITNFFGK